MALTAPPATQALLLDLQQLDTELNQQARRRRDLPELTALATLEGQTDALRQTLADRTGELDDARIELSRVESDVELVEKRIARDSERLQGSSSVKDIQGLEHEVASLTARLGDLEEIELAVMEKVEQLEGAVAEARAALDEHAAALAEAGAARDAAVAGLDGERGHTTANRATVAAKIPEDLLALYEKQRERYGVGASHLRARVSSASGVELTGSDLALVRQSAADAVLLCPDSNAILVRTDESGL